MGDSKGGKGEIENGTRGDYCRCQLTYVIKWGRLKMQDLDNAGPGK